MKTLIYFAGEISDENELNRIKSMSVSVVEAERGMLHYLPYPDQCLVIAATGETVSEAKEFGAAVVGYQHGNLSLGEFLKVDYVIQGFEEVELEFLERIYLRHHHLPWTIQETQRCVIRELTISDLDALFELYSKPGVTDYMEPLYEYEEELEYEKSYISNMYRYFGYGMWLVFHKDTGELIGRAGLEHRDYKEDTELEMGYVISPDYQRQGYATEVCEAIIQYAREYTEYDRLNCLIDADNKASIGLVKKLGFSEVGECDVTGESLLRFVKGL